MRSIFFPIYVWLIEHAACYETETQITVSDHDIKQLVTFGACYTGFIKVLNSRATELDTRAKNWQGPEGLAL